MNQKATIYDYARMCRTYHTNCPNCPMWNEVCTFCIMDNTQVDKANEIILKWCEKHPVKTRKDKFLEIYPNANVRDGVVRVCPKDIESSRHCQFPKCECLDCLRNYWLAEVDE